MIFTHTVAMELSEPKDGIKRVCAIALGEDRKYYLAIKTYWPDENDPTVTQLSMSPEGFKLVTETLNLASMRLMDYPIGEQHAE